MKEKKPIQKWIERERVTVDSSVRDLRALRKPKPRSRKGVTPGRTRQLNAVVTLCFRTYDEAVDTLADLVIGNPHLEVRSHRAFAEALKAKVGLDDFQKVKDRIR